MLYGEKREQKEDLMRIILLLGVVFGLVSCVQVRTGNDVVDATSAVASGIYMQQQIDAKKAKSAQPDIFKTTDPKVKDIDQAIENARRRTLPEVDIPQKS